MTRFNLINFTVMPDQQASTTTVQNDCKKKQKMATFLSQQIGGRLQSEFSSNPYPTQDHRIKLFQELKISPLQ